MHTKTNITCVYVRTLSCSGLYAGWWAGMDATAQPDLRMGALWGMVEWTPRCGGNTTDNCKLKTCAHACMCRQTNTNRCVLMQLPDANLKSICTQTNLYILCGSPYIYIYAHVTKNMSLSLSLWNLLSPMSRHTTNVCRSFCIMPAQ